MGLAVALRLAAVYRIALWSVALVLASSIYLPAAAAVLPGLGSTHRSAELIVPLAPELIKTRFVQVYPPSKDALTVQRSRGERRAIVLIHGLQFHPFSSSHADVPAFRDWQKPGSTLIKQLSKKGDVFAFAYTQNAAIDVIADGAHLGEDVQRLREIGYSEIVLIGHSAGGLLARQFVEEHPQAGVTKVIQVCTPNSGSSSAKIEIGIHKEQKVFLESLTREARADYLKAHWGRRIPAGLQFICVVGKGAAEHGDGVVACDSQWPRDLQEQGIPMVLLHTTHFTVMRSRVEGERIAAIAAGSYPRWDMARIISAKKSLGEK